MVLKELKYKEADFTNHSYWEEVPTEDLWEDGELRRCDMPEELFEKVIITGEWKLIRRKDG